MTERLRIEVTDMQRHEVTEKERLRSKVAERLRENQTILVFCRNRKVRVARCTG